MDNPLKMKFKAHQTFAIRKGWLGKGLRGVRDVSPTLLMPSSSREAMDELGLGANQVVALRYWLQTLGLIERVRRNREHTLTNIGNLILENDPYTDEVGTLWALHCNLVSAQADAASWFFFFNEFKMNVFGKDDFTHAIERYIFSNNEKTKVALTSLESDFNCILNTYIPHNRISGKVISPESVIDCPLGELGLLDVDDSSRKTYRKKPANPSTLPALFLLYAICPTSNQMANGFEAAREIRLDTLLDGPCMPGRVFNLDSVALLNKLYELESDGLVRINRTAGLDVVRLVDPKLTKEECLTNYYRMIG